MNRYSKYFLQNILWLDDGFCQYYLLDSVWGHHNILDAESVVFDLAEEAEQWLTQCADHDPFMTLRRLRVFLSEDCLEHFSVHKMNDGQVVREVSRQLSRHAYPVVIEPRMGWAVQVDAATTGPVQPLSVEPAPDLDGLLADLKVDLDALVAEQQKKSDAIEAQLVGMSEAEKAAFYGKKTGGTIWDNTGGGLWGIVKSAPGAIWSAAKAFPGFYVGYLKTVWKVAQTPGKMSALAADALMTGDMNPLKDEIDKIVDPVAHTYEQAAEYKSMLTVLFSDQATYNLFYDFAQRYYNATHPVELAQMGVSAATDIIVTVILAIFTPGVGAVANVAAKSTRLVSVFKKLKKITTTIKKLAPDKKLPGRGKSSMATASQKKRPSAASNKGVPEVQKPKPSEKLDNKKEKVYDEDNKGDGQKKSPGDTNKTPDKSKQQNTEEIYPPRTGRAIKESKHVATEMDKAMSKKKNPSTTVMTHEDGTVSVGMSGEGNAKNIAKAKKLEDHLNKDLESPKYKVSGESMPTEKLKEVPDGNSVGACSEPKAANAAHDNPSPIDGFDTRWRGKADNPRPLMGKKAGNTAVDKNQMSQCPTCADPKNAKEYMDYANNSGN